MVIAALQIQFKSQLVELISLSNGPAQLVYTKI